MFSSSSFYPSLQLFSPFSSFRFFISSLFFLYSPLFFLLPSLAFHLPPLSTSAATISVDLFRRRRILPPPSTSAAAVAFCFTAWFPLKKRKGRHRIATVAFSGHENGSIEGWVS
ncbi:unnamed protein product [Cuscuta epithymum]|uniref:Transmembrane protein n=1 Tax=Cuscuta epithymum TaxID=186058 RepID=A0AAV0EJH9_9ASTE|nr:unnamed protein product [Cuscuta epithymum]